jgi:predicted RNase H-like HicB family nuclease
MIEKMRRNRKVARYIALIDGNAGAYGVVFPDLPGCAAMGETIDAELANAAAAMHDWIDVVKEAGWNLPPSTAAAPKRR